LKNEQEEKKAVPAEDNILNISTTTADLLMKDANNPEVTLNTV
jgi:hypothetical protein